MHTVHATLTRWLLPASTTGIRDQPGFPCHSTDTGQTGRPCFIAFASPCACLSPPDYISPSSRTGPPYALSGTPACPGPPYALSGTPACPGPPFACTIAAPVAAGHAGSSAAAPRVLERHTAAMRLGLRQGTDRQQQSRGAVERVGWLLQQATQGLSQQAAVHGSGYGVRSSAVPLGGSVEQQGAAGGWVGGGSRSILVAWGSGAEDGAGAGVLLESTWPEGVQAGDAILTTPDVVGVRHNSGARRGRA